MVDTGVGGDDVKSIMGELMGDTTGGVLLASTLNFGFFLRQEDSFLDK